MIFEPMTLKDAEELYDKLKKSTLEIGFKKICLDDLLCFTDNFERDYGSPKTTTKYYVEISHCENIDGYVIQSKWFDTADDAREWYATNIDYVDDDHDAYLMYAEWCVTDDSYDNIEVLEILPRN